MLAAMVAQSATAAVEHLEVLARHAAAARDERLDKVDRYLTALEAAADLAAAERLRAAWIGYLLAERPDERRRVLAVAATIADVRARMLIGSFREFADLRTEHARAERALAALLPTLALASDGQTGRRRSPREVYGPNPFDAPFTADTWADPHGWVGRWSDGEHTLDVVAYPMGTYMGRLRVPGSEAARQMIGFIAAGNGEPGVHLELIGLDRRAWITANETRLATGDRVGQLRRVPVGKTSFESRLPEAKVLLAEQDVELSAFQHATGAPPQWRVLDGTAVEIAAGTGSLFTKEKFGDVRVYLEFRHAYNSESLGPRRGNSGLYLANAYEIQLVDSFGLEPSATSSGAVYHLAAPRVNACAPPLEWQSLEVVFRAARFDAHGRKTASARVTAWMNGLLIHDDIELPHPTAASLESARKLRDPRGPQPLMLQSHGNLLQFRRMWVLPLP